jgi:hypothetical protein
MENVENNYIPFFNHFTSTSQKIQHVLNNVYDIKDNDYKNIIFTGHSIGATNARVQKRRFNNSFAYGFNSGEGLLSNSVTSNIYRTFLNDHIGLVVKKLASYTMPFLGEDISSGMVVLGK